MGEPQQNDEVRGPPLDARTSCQQTKGLCFQEAAAGDGLYRGFHVSGAQADN